MLPEKYVSFFSLFPEPPTSCQVYTKEGSRILSCWALLVCCVYLLCQRLFICGVAGIWSGVSSGLKWQVGSYRCTVDTGIKNESLTGDYSLWVSGCHQSFWEKVDVYSQNPAVFVAGETRKESLCDTICVIIYIFKGHIIIVLVKQRWNQMSSRRWGYIFTLFIYFYTLWPFDPISGHGVTLFGARLINRLLKACQQTLKSNYTIIK